MFGFGFGLGAVRVDSVPAGSLGSFGSLSSFNFLRIFRRWPMGMPRSDK